MRHVPFLDRRLGALLGAAPGFGARLARLESAVLADEMAAVEPLPPVWVCGMARSGSTIMLELLNALPDFTTHRYSDYPWVWTPYWWNRLRVRLPLPAIAAAERAHRDRIVVTRDSPEAFEEIFWMHFFADRHAPEIDQVLDAQTSCPAFERFFYEHQRKLLAARGARRYLAKANYHLPRLGYLHRLHPAARFVIPVREPLAQVASLVKQDALFRRLDSEDRAVGAHLARIGHYEFGPHKRALNLGDAAATEAITQAFAGGASAEAYAMQWAAQYRYALERMRNDKQLSAACLWVGYERLCAAPAPELARVANHLSLDAASTAALIGDGIRRLAVPDYYNPEFADGEIDRIRELTTPLWDELAAWLERPPLKAT